MTSDGRARRGGKALGNIYTLTTDFGPGEYVGAMKGVLLALDPDATVVDVDHTIRPQDVRHGAYVLRSVAPHYPFAVHIGVVDPGVGTKRRAIVAVCESAFLVGPDNGLLMPAAKRLGLKEVREITNRALLAREVSDTFHGRDVFAPVAARLMTGTKVREVGPAIRDPVDLDFGKPKPVPGGYEGGVITHDRFGNVITNIPREAVDKRWKTGDSLRVSLGGYDATVRLVRTYAEVASGDFLATYASSGFLEIARRNGSAAAQLGTAPGAPVLVTRA